MRTRDDKQQRDCDTGYELQRRAYYDALIDAHNAQVAARTRDSIYSAAIIVFLGCYLLLCLRFPQLFFWPFAVLWFVVHPFLWAVDMLLQGYSSHQLFVIPDWLWRNL